MSHLMINKIQNQRREVEWTKTTKPVDMIWSKPSFSFITNEERPIRFPPAAERVLKESESGSVALKQIKRLGLTISSPILTS